MPEAVGTRIEAVAGAPLPHGLLSLPTALPMQDVHEQMGIAWQPVDCGVAAATGWCPPDPGDPELEKSFNSVGSEESPPVTVYAGVECAAVGWTFDEGVERARSILSTGEQVALESWTWDNLLTPGAVDVSAEPGDGSVVGRLGVLEEALAGVYGGVGVLHVPVVLSAYMQAHGLVIQQGSRLRTRTGHDVVIGAGYPGADNGNTRMILTGPVAVRQGAVATAPRSDHESLSVATNDRRVLAERTSVVMVQCGKFIVNVARECCGGAA